MAQTTYIVTGMTCDHCAGAVRQEVGSVPGVTGVDVSLDSGQLIVTSDQVVDEAAVRAAVEEAGYDLAAAP